MNGLAAFCGTRTTIAGQVRLDDGEDNKMESGSTPAGGQLVEIQVRTANLVKVQDSSAWKMEVNGAGVHAHKEGRFEDAVRIFSQYLDVCPGACKFVHNNRAGSLLQLGLHSEAMKDAEACLSIDWKWDKGWLRKVETLRRSGRFCEALDVALDGRKSLGHSAKLREQVDELLAMPENEGFLRDHVPTTTADRLPHSSICSEDLRRAHAEIGLLNSGRVWYGHSEKGDGRFVIKIDGKLLFRFPDPFCNLCTLWDKIFDWQSWASAAVASPDHLSSASAANEALQFVRIVGGVPGAFRTPEDELLHSLATDVAAYPLTIWYALRRFGMLDAKRSETLVIHIVGAEASSEGKAHEETLRILRSFLGPSRSLLIASIGPLYLAAEKPEWELQVMSHWRSVKGTASAPCMHQAHRMDYAAYLASDLYEKPDLVVFFHPGFHDGTYPWWPTLQFLLHEDVPLAFTSFSEEDFLQNADFVDNEVFRPNIHFGSSLEDALNPFESAAWIPLHGDRGMKYPHRYLAGWRGVQKRFPKGGGAFDAGHLEAMALSVVTSVLSATSAREKYLLQSRGRSYVEFALALAKFRPHPDGMMRDTQPEVWAQVLKVLDMKS